MILNSINQSVESRIKSIEDKVNALIESLKSTSESKTVEYQLQVLLTITHVAC